MNKVALLTLSAFLLLQLNTIAQVTETKPAETLQTPTIVPVIVNGEAQKIPAFENPELWIKQHLWVETEFDTDGDGKKDRMHVDVTRPQQTETEGLKLPVIYESSPYFAGTASMDNKYNWNVKQQLDGPSPERLKAPAIVRTGKEAIISTSQTRTWIPY
jgi:X-Pro dipeptidyl-peptidase